VDEHLGDASREDGPPASATGLRERRLYVRSIDEGRG
jgi:hypothetical protein